MTTPRNLLRLSLLLVGLQAVAHTQAHFKFARPATAEGSKQNYIVLDEGVISNTRPDLGDIRLYGTREVPYVLRTQRAARYRDWAETRLLNKGVVRGNTQFTVDAGVPEYDCIELELTTKDFVARALIEGADDSSAAAWNDLGEFSLYDFSKERLGSNKNVRLKSPVRYRYLRVTISGGVQPDEVQSAKIANLQEDKASYTVINALPDIRQQGNRTIVTWNASERLPVERLVVEVDPGDVNFSRDAALFCDERRVSSNELSRVRLVRKGRQVEYESLAIEPYGLRCRRFKLDILNGDDPPLHISGVRPMMYERRLFFDPKGEAAFKLYYGDEKTGAPHYDYAKFFEPAGPSLSVQAELQPEAPNPAFTPWPDDRPFTERYPAVLWVAMIAAVGLLGAWALKGFKS